MDFGIYRRLRELGVAPLDLDHEDRIRSLMERIPNNIVANVDSNPWDRQLSEQEIQGLQNMVNAQETIEEVRAGTVMYSIQQIENEDVRLIIFGYEQHSEDMAPIFEPRRDQIPLSEMCNRHNYTNRENPVSIEEVEATYDLHTNRAIRYSAYLRTSNLLDRFNPEDDSEW